MASSSTIVYENAIVPTPANYGNRKFLSKSPVAQSVVHCYKRYTI